MEKDKKPKFTDFYETVEIMGNDGLSNGHLGDEEFSFVNSRLLHRDHTFPWSTPLFYTTFFSIGFLIEAHGQIIVDKQQFTVKPGMFFVNKPGELQQLTWYSVQESYGLLFTEEFISKYAGISIYKTFPFLLFERQVPLQTSVEFRLELKKILLLIVQELERDSPLQKKICANLLTRFLLKIKQEYWEGYKIHTSPDRNPDILKDFTQNLEYHYDQLLKGKVNRTLYIKDYAEMQQLHENYLSSVLKEKTGKTGGQLIAEKTLSTAKILMEDSRFSIKEISYMLGFSYMSYFSIFFKKHTGLSPVEYRKKNLKI
ncbi:AraC family transcriptional regulator [Flavobacterium sp. DG2-3]|uniref:helix-turn-helix domain-containing protein n=1 Tax=Flavobacterium sp. DG2-3 TaxID=3068317 RepID=UPI00274019E1|nr:AraC family transcriptional regulator [Flavobacterium sp. DG2-3]MDP5199097.1 AraC family transcriptional regulator [Flavobacterium sp. DG2-3]